MRTIARIVMAAVIAVTASSTVMAAGKPLRVYIMAGQSNMQGSAHQSTFKAIGDDPATSPLLSMILDKNGDPAVCDNAWISYFTQQDGRDTVLQGKVKVGYGFDHERIGPEYAFGLYMDKAHDEPILIIKTAWGGKSLAVDFRPPSAGPYVPSQKEREQGNVPAKDQVGHFYREMIRNVRATLNNAESIRKIVPGYDAEQGYELAGFVWFQGWNDMCNRHHIQQYTENMIHFISDVRKEFNSPRMPFIVGILGVYGTDPDSRKFDKSLPVTDFRKTQFAAVEQYDQKVAAEYRGNVIAVDSGPFYELALSDIYWKQRLTNEWKWRVKQGEMTREAARKERERYGFTKNGLTKKEKRIWKRCASNAEYHYLGSAKTFIRLGKAFADGMLGMAQSLSAQEVPESKFLGNRYFTFNTIVRVNQIETSRDVNNGEDESIIHSPAEARVFRETIEKGWPGARITWAFSWLALKDERPNYLDLKKLIVSYHEKYGDEITFIPGGYFANMYNTREQVNRDLHDGLQMVSDMVGGGYRPLSVIAGYLSADNLRYLADVEGIHVCQGNIWSQYAVDNGDGDGSVSYPYYPSKEHFLKPAQGKEDLIDCVNLDGWTMDFLSARHAGGRTINGEWCGSRQGVGPIETVIRLGTERGTQEMLAVTSAHFDKGFELNDFAWVTCTWELGLVEARKIYGYKGRNGMEGMLIWFSEMRKRWPDAQCITLGEFGMRWREQFKNNEGLNYRFVQRGTGVCGSEPELEMRWFMNKDFRLAILREWQENKPGNVIDFTRYDLKAKEPADPEPGKHSRNWSLMNRLNQKGVREQDKPIDISLLNEEEKRLIRKWYPDLIEPAVPVMDSVLNFNAGWHFHLGETPGFHEQDFDDSGWRILDVPHDWSVEGQFAETNPSGVSGGYLPIGIGCYRKHFVLPEGSKGKRIKIRFDGVYMNSTVYLNGIYLGNRPYGFSTFEYDLTPHLKHKGEPNVIAVKVDNSLAGNCRWYTGSGINRNVHLYITEQQHFKSFGTFFRTTSIDGDVARMKVDCEIVSNDYPESMRVNFQLFPEEWKKVVKKARIVAILRDKDGGRFAETTDSLELSDYTTIKSSLNMEAGNPMLWSDKNPYLYTLELQLWIDGRLVDTEQQKVGIRTVGFNKDQGLVVNGEKVIVKGVCLHKDAGSFGTAVPKDVWRYRLGKLKELGCNAIRTHGPVDPAFIDVCDEKGFYMMAEAFDEWNKTWHYGRSEDPAGKKLYTYHLFFNQWAETDVRDMVRRDRNHASVFMYSVGNEVPDQRYSDGHETLKKLIGWAKEEDDTRMVTATCDWSAWANANGFFDAMDIAGYNYPDRYFKEHYQEEHARYPNRILVGAENYLTLKNWLAVRDNPYVVGLFLWVGIDYLGESLDWPRRGWEWGLIDIGGFEKTLYYYWQAFWSEKPMVHIAVNLKTKDEFEWRAYNVASHWNFNPGDVDTVFLYSNAEKVELYQNGKSLGKKEVNSDTYQAIYLVDYKKGELTAKAFKNKATVATHTLKTAGEPKNLVLKEEWKSESTDNDRLIFLTLEIQDEKGTRCPFAKNEITVDVTGAGELIGLDSGNQFSHELYKQNKREAHEGRLLLTIRPKGKGSISVQCRAGGLESGTISIQNNYQP